MVVIGQNCCFWAKVDVFRQTWLILGKYFKSVKLVVLGKSECIRVKKGVFGKKRLCSAKVVVFVQKLLYLNKVVVFE